MTISQINPAQLQPPGDDGLGPIIRVGPSRRCEAVERLVSSPGYSDRDHGRRFMEYARVHSINLEHMWSRLDRFDRVRATVLVVPSPGRTAMVFSSHPGTRDQVPSVAGLISHACLHLPVEVSLAQVLLEPRPSVEREVFVAAGFFDLAILSYLERSIRLPRSIRPPAIEWPPGVAPIRFHESMSATLLEVLDRSYEDTLDCAGLRGYRKTEDILEGHRASGLFDQALWTILEVDGSAAGALLLNPSSDRRSIELVYLGLVKSARGRGLGTLLLRHGLALVRGRHEHMMHLAVDEVNRPALTLYKREGFRPAMRRAALIRPLGALESRA